MKDPELLRETGSEELTREDVQDIQQRYNLETNGDFCFIMCDRSKFDWITKETTEIDPARRAELVEGIIGDINLFSSNSSTFEINVDPMIRPQIMLAEQSYRRKGLASEALKTVHIFAQQKQQKTRIVAKINEDNEGSVRLFAKEGYSLVGRVAAFAQVEFELVL